MSRLVVREDSVAGFPGDRDRLPQTVSGRRYPAGRTSGRRTTAASGLFASAAHFASQALGATPTETGTRSERARVTEPLTIARTCSGTSLAHSGAPERTIIVYAAGNESHTRPNWVAALPYYILDARGHQLAVVATDPETRQIAGYSDSCGPLPGDWDASLHGPHFCLAAPGTVRGLVPNAVWPDRVPVEDVTGTSFAAPIVSGALALMMEHFRDHIGRGRTLLADP